MRTANGPRRRFAVRPLLVLLIAGALAAACGHPDDQRATSADETATAGSATPAGTATPVLTATPAETATPAPTATPRPDEWTGIAGVDEIIRLEMAGDGAALADRIQMTQEPCSFHPEAGYPPLCGPEQSEGQMVDVFPMGSCEGGFVREDEARSYIAASHRKTELYAVVDYSASPRATDNGYWIAFTYRPPSGVGGFVYVVRDGRITEWFRFCGGQPAVEAQRDHLIPLMNTALPPDRRTNIWPLDQIIANVERGNSHDVSAWLSYEQKSCSTNYSPGDGLHCRDGEAEHAAIQVFPAEGCVNMLLRSGEADALVARALGDDGSRVRLYAIGLPSAAEVQHVDYHLFFAGGETSDARGFELDVRDGQIVRFDDGCGPISRRLRGVENFLLAPNTAASEVDPDPLPATGIADIDEIIRLVASGDAAGVATKVRITLVPCGLPGDGFGVVRCQAGDAPGTPIEAVVRGSCEVSYRRLSDALQFPVIMRSLRLYSVSQTTYGEYLRPFAPAYSLFFSDPSSPRSSGTDAPAVRIDVGAGQIVSIATTCGSTEESSNRGTRLIVAPPDQR